MAKKKYSAPMILLGMGIFAAALLAAWAFPIPTLAGVILLVGMSVSGNISRVADHVERSEMSLFDLPNDTAKRACMAILAVLDGEDTDDGTVQ